MSLKIRIRSALGLALGILMAGSSGAVDYLYLLGQVPKAQEAITAYGTDLFGDTVNLYDGSLSIEHTDLSLPGNSALPVKLTRAVSPGKSEVATYSNRAFGDWALQLPRVGGSFAAATGWRGRDGSFSRCTKYWFPAMETVLGGPDRVHDISSDAFWHGNHLEVPGHGSQELLKRLPAFQLQPAGQSTFPLVTKGLWQIGCLATIANGAGEGFFAISPEGVRYEFNWLVERTTDAVRLAGGYLARKDVHLHATRVTDRFGNWVAYNYHPGTSGQLASIVASDGRSITLGYSGGRIATAWDGTRLVQYAYHGNGSLWKVTLPGGRHWEFALRGLVPMQFEYQLSPEGCEDAGYLMRPDVHTGSITHPTGAVITFTTRYVLLDKSNVPFSCYPVDGHPRLTYMPNEVNVALTSKVITGPALPRMEWKFDYGGAIASRITKVTEPDASLTRHHFGNVWMGNEGLLLKVEKGWSTAGALQTITNNYRTWHGGPFPEQFGRGYLEDRGQYYAPRNVPLQSVTYTQQGKSFTWNVTSFDALARPVSVVKSGPGGSRTETTTYRAAGATQLSPYVVGPISSIASGAHVMEATDYDPATVLPTQRREFGIVKSNFTHHPDGQLWTRSFGSTSHVVSTTDYHRGIPRQVSYPTGAVERVVVNNIGKITEFTSAAGFTTGYGDDDAWHLNRVTPPPGFNPTTITFSANGSAVYGLPVGHWRQTVIKGRAQSDTYFDSFWRPLMTRTFDMDDQASTRKVVVKRYDAAGRMSFESYPRRDFGSIAVSSPGRRMQYDALGRQTRLDVDGELGVLTTTTSPLSNEFGVSVTQPNGNTSVTRYWALDKPEE